MSDSDRLTGAERAPSPLADDPALTVEFGDVLVALATFCASLAVLTYGLGAHASTPLFILRHLMVLMLPAGYLAIRVRRSADVTVPVLLVLATLAAGPVGALGCMVMALALRRQRPSPARLGDWYDYIAGVVARSRLARIYDELSSGRLPTDPAAAVPRFRPILHGGSVEEQQRVLGVIGRRYHPEFRVALRAALRNKNGFIRAQAAAVASRLSIEEKARLWSAGTAGIASDQPAPADAADAGRARQSQER
jgi:hypothetical protein